MAPPIPLLYRNPRATSSRASAVLARADVERMFRGELPYFARNADARNDRSQPWLAGLGAVARGGQT